MIRNSTFEDESAILKLDDEFFDYTRNKFDDSLTEFQKLQIQNILIARISNLNSTCLFIAEDKNIVVGFVTGKIRTVDKDKADLNNIFITEHYRSQGIGADLFEKFLDWVKTYKVKMILVEYYIDDIDAKNFYKKLGFKESKEVARNKHEKLEFLRI